MPTLNKLEYLDETKGQIKNALNTKFNSGIQDNDTFRSYVDKIKNIYTNWPRVTGEDASLSLTPTKKGLMSLNLKGNTSQDAEPTPDSPQDIHTVSGENSVKVGNKNIFDGIFESGIINGTTGLDVSNSNYIRNKNYIPVEELTNYKMSTDGTVFDYFLVYEYKEDYTYNLTSNKTVYFNGYLTTNSGTKYIRFRPGSATTDTNIKVMVEKGTTATSYVPHQEQTYPLTLADLEYCKISTYEDLFFKNVVGSSEYQSNLELNKWYLKKNIGKVVLNGSNDENWQSSGQGTNTYRFSLNQSVFQSGTNGYCSNNKYVTSGVSSDEQLVGIVSSVLYYRLNKSLLYEFSTTALRTFLSNNNAIIYAPLITPTYTLLSDTLQTQLDNLSNALSYQDQTNISQTNDDLGFIISASALMKGGN